MTTATRRLAEQASEGDRPALEELYARQLPAFRAFVQARMGEVIRSRESPSDIVQSVFREVLEELGRFEWKGEAAFRQWLFQRGIGKILNRHRYYRAACRDVVRDIRPGSEDEGFLVHCLAAACTPAIRAMGREELLNFEDAFAAMPDAERDVIFLARVAELPRAEIARQMGRSESAVRSLLSRALVRLAREYESRTGQG